MGTTVVKKEKVNIWYVKLYKKELIGQRLTLQKPQFAFATSTDSQTETLRHSP
jgi:hypothetical protein